MLAAGLVRRPDRRDRRPAGPAPAGPLPRPRHLRLRRRCRATSSSRTPAFYGDGPVDRRPPRALRLVVPGRQGVLRPVRHRVRRRSASACSPSSAARSADGWPPCATARRRAPPSASTSAARSSRCSASRRSSPASAGALFGGLQQSVSDIPFEPINNIVLFLFAVVGGITTVSGALIGGALFALLPSCRRRSRSSPGSSFAGVAAVAIGLGRQPNGLAGIISSWRRAAGSTDRRSTAHATATDDASPGAAGGHRCRARLSAHGAGVADRLRRPACCRARSRRRQRARRRPGRRPAMPTCRLRRLQLSRAGPTASRSPTTSRTSCPLPPPLLQISVPEALATSAVGPDLDGARQRRLSREPPGQPARPRRAGVARQRQLRAALPAAGPRRLPRGAAGGAPGHRHRSRRSAAADIRGADATSTMAATDLPGLVEHRLGHDVGAHRLRGRPGRRPVAGRVRQHRPALRAHPPRGGRHRPRRHQQRRDGGRAGGTTTIGGATILGLPAAIGPDGIIVGDQPRRPTPGPWPRSSRTCAALGPTSATRWPARSRRSTTRSPRCSARRTATVNDLLAPAGIRIRRARADRHHRRARGVDHGERPRRRASSTTAAATTRWPSSSPSSPPTSCPSEGIPGVPLNTSPQALVNLLKETHVVGLAFAYGTARWSPRQPSPRRPPPRADPPRPAASPSGSLAVVPAEHAGLLHACAGARPRRRRRRTIDTTATVAVRGKAISAIIVVLALLSSILWAVGSRRARRQRARRRRWQRVPTASTALPTRPTARSS